MRRTKRGGWPYSQPPNVPFDINLDSPQAKGLVMWWPALNERGTYNHRDLVRGLVFTENGTPEWRNQPGRDWMLHFTRGDPDWLTGLLAPVTATPLTLSVRFVIDSGLGAWTGMKLLTLTDPAVGDFGEHFAVHLHTLADNVTWSCRAVTRDAGGTNQAAGNTTGDFGLHLLTAVFHSPTDRRIYLDGILLASNNVNRVPAGIDRTLIGAALQWEDHAEPFWGLLADACVYNRALTAAEVCEYCRDPWELCKPLVPWTLAGSPVTVRIPRYGFTNFRVPGIV